MFRGSRPEVFFEKRVLKNFAKFKGKHLCWCLVFNKTAGLRFVTCVAIFKKTLQQRCFPVNSAEFLKPPLLYRILVGT